MRPVLAALVPVALAIVSPGAAAQSLYKCTQAGGRVTYQETPCLADRVQKRLDAPRPAEREEEVARRLLEREAAQGSELAGRFAHDARDRELARQREREAIAREERLRRQREKENRPIEDVPWESPWGFPAKPGLAKPPPRPGK
jgi:hypothetical protein